MNTVYEPIRVVATIETRIYRDGIAQLLDNYSDIEVIATSSSLQETFEICTDTLPQVLLIDATMPGVLSTIRKIKESSQNVKIILLSMAACRMQMSKFAGEGVQEFVTREDSIDDLRQSIIAAMKNGFWCSSQVAKLLLEQAPAEQVVEGSLPDSSLTKQQVNVLQLLESGISNKEIARKLHIETATVKNHVHHILQKLQVSSRGEAAAVYRRLYGTFTTA